MGKVTDYMPTTDEVRGSLVFLNKHYAEQCADVDVDLLVVESETAAQFDRWLVEVERAAAARALDEAAYEIFVHPGEVDPGKRMAFHMGADAVYDALRARAEAYRQERGEQ